jgi:thiol-disulfide isomerase/thioredoxin
MKIPLLTRSLALLALLLTPLCLTAQRSTLTEITSVTPSDDAKVMMAEIDKAHLLVGPQPQSFFEGKTRTDLMREREANHQKIRQIAVDFCKKHPQDPLRWEGVLHMIMVQPEFITEFKPGFDDAKSWNEFRSLLVIDEAAKDAWTKELETYKTSLRTAADVPWEIQEKMAHLDNMDYMSKARGEEKYNIFTFLPKVDDLAARFPEGKLALQEYRSALSLSKIKDEAVLETFWKHLAESPNKVVKTAGEAELRKIDANRKPMEMKFTAVDGREVDLEKLRGKVVLIDFWATWCGPCIAELPNILSVYNKYHDKGFEIIGISLDQEKDKEKLIKFTQERNMPWPQYFDGKGWKNEISTQYAISSIPAMFLLDQRGVLISTNARGERLETEVKRLLKIKD